MARASLRLRRPAVEHGTNSADKRRAARGEAARTAKSEEGDTDSAVAGWPRYLGTLVPDTTLPPLVGAGAVDAAEPALLPSLPWVESASAGEGEGVATSRASSREAATATPPSPAAARDGVDRSRPAPLRSPIPAPAALAGATPAPTATPSTSVSTLVDRAGSAEARAMQAADEAATAEGDEHGADDADKPGKTESETAAKPDEAGKTAKGERDRGGKGAAESGAGRRARGGPSLGEEEEATVETEFPADLVMEEEHPLAVPALTWSPLTPQWPIASNLPGDALPMPTARKTAPQQPNPAESKPPASGKKPAATGARAPAPGDSEQVRRTEQDARAYAQRAYLDLAQAARREQDAFLGRANDVLQAMAHAYELSAAALIDAHQADIGALRMATERACAMVESAADFAELRLETAASNASVAITAAGGSAYGLIAAGERGAAQKIGEVVGSLVSGHIGAYNGAIGQATLMCNVAVLALNLWRDNRATNYPTSGDALEGAKNESRQTRIPRWADSEATRMGTRLDDKRKAWESSRDSSACSLSCSYRSAMETEHARMVTEGRKSVSSALSRARRTLTQQKRDGQRMLRELRQSTLQQIRVQSRATESRLGSQVRIALGSAHNEAKGALSGVHGAASGALPSYWRGVQGFDQTLRRAAPRGAQALRQSAERGPEGVLQGIRRSSNELDTRLRGNRSRLERGLSERQMEQQQSRGEQLTQFDASQQEQVGGAGARLDQSAGGVVTAFEGLADTVSQSAASWAQPLETRMAGFIAQKRAEAAAALQGLLTGEAPASAGPAAPGAAGGEGGGAAACGECATAGAGGAATGTGAAPAAAGAGAAAGPQGLTAQVQEEVDHFAERVEPATFFAEQLEDTGSQVETNLSQRAANIAGKFEGGFGGTVDEEGAIAVLRGLTAVKGHALDVDIYPGLAGPTLDSDLYYYLNDDPDDLAACRAYLRGDAVEGARLELANSTGFFNDDEARIEATMRALSPEQLAALGQAAPGVMADVRDALGGTDRRVFDALAAGDHALADAWRMREAVDEARSKNDADAVHTAIEQYTGAPGEGDWRSSEQAEALVPVPAAGERELSAADRRRTAVVAALGGIVSDEDVARGVEPGTDVARLSAEDRAVAYVTRSVEIYVPDGGGGGGRIETRRLEGANRDLAAALMRQGEGSVEARASRLGVEMQRRGEPPNPLNIDRATFDERFSADLAHASPEERAAHRRAAADRARVVMLAAERYAGGEEAPEGFTPGADHATDPTAPMSDTRVTAARDRLVGSLRDRFGSDTVGADLAAGLLTDARPSPDTAALAARHAMYARTGTNEELLFRFTERMNRDEIAAMRTSFSRQTGGLSLDAELGVYGEGGTFTELSGDDRLRMERAMLGVPRNDRERLETAAFALQQQRREAGSLGSYLAEGTLAERVMNNTERRLEMLAGGPIALSRRGELLAGMPVFDREGRYTGPDRDSFLATTRVAQTVAENYAKRIDAFADILTTGIAILGAIAAAVIIVATGGAAAPLIAAAIVTGLASMAANYAIKGGRYGWEQAAIDLGMTAVQAITAGVGAQLGAAAQVASKGAQAASQASRTLATLSRLFTGNPVVDQIIVGAITGSISGLGTSALNEQTWEGKDPVGALFAGLLRGAVAGAGTAAVTNSIEALGRNGAAIAGRAREIAAGGGVLRGAVGLAGRGVGRVGMGINTALTASTGGGALRSAGAMMMRGGARAVTSGLGGAAGRGGEILVDTATGRFKGDAGEALTEMGRAGLHSAVQGFGEGAGEAGGTGIHNRRMQAAETSINNERESLGLHPLEGEHLRAAAEDLTFMNVHGRGGSDGLARALNLEHVATHGGMAPTVATRNPTPVVEDGMRAELMRHISPDRHGEFADIPIRVLPESEYRALTRSESGPVVTVIQDGQPVVIVREGTPLSRLADEGPHLLQARDASTRERVARLDEATLARWDSLDLDTQIDLYRTKIELEIDAHEQIQRSLARETPTGEQAVARHAAEVERNEATLRNLRARADEVQNLTPERRASIAAGEEARPQYLEQPARLFSKERRRGRRAGAEDEGRPEDRPLSDTETLRALEIAEIRRMLGARGLVEDEFQNLPEAQQRFLRMRERMPDRSDIPRSYETEARARAREEFGQLLHDALFGGPGTRMTDASRERLDIEHLIYVMETGRLPPGVEFHHLLPVADFPEFAHLAEAGLALIKASHLEAAHGMDTTRPLEAGTLLDPGAETRPIGMHTDPEAVKGSRARQRDIAAGTRSTGDVDRDLARDFRQRVVDASREVQRAEDRARRPRATDRDRERLAEARVELVRAQAAETEVQARLATRAEMRGELVRHIPPDQRQQFADVPIRVMPADRYDALTRSKSGPVVTTIEDGRPVVLVREGTPPARLADEGPHLVQAREAGTRERVARLDEATMRDWDKLDLATQIELYRTKIELEIDAHQRIARSLESESPRNAADLDRNEGTLRNLRARLSEVEGLGPQQRASIESGTQTRPQYLDQPARLFSKDSPSGETSGRPPPRVVFEPFSGPSVASAQDLQRRYPGAQVIAAEGSRLPAAADIAAFEQQGGRFIAERFGQSLPDNSVDQMHVRFPLSHEKIRRDMTVNTESDRLAHPGLSEMEIYRAREAAIESVTNLAPHALRVLSPGGEMEIVYYEGRAIAKEIEAATQHVWKDPETGVTYRLEVVAPATLVPRTVAPHSGHGVPDVPEVNLIKLRKVPVATAEPAVPEPADSRLHMSTERETIRQERTQRKMRESDARARRQAAAREREAEAARQVQIRKGQQEALERRQENVDAEVAEGRRAVEEGRLTPDQDFQRRLEIVARQMDISVEQLAQVIRHFKDELGGSGRVLDAQDVVDSLRNRTRDGRPPRHGDLEGLVAEIIVEQNAVAVQQMREHIAQTRPDAVLGVERGGAFLADVLAGGVEGFPPALGVPKHVEQRPGRPDKVQRTPNLEEEIRRRITAPELRQSRFAIVDFYMGGAFAGELQTMIQKIVRDHPHVVFEVMWMRESHGFERVVHHPDRPNPRRPTRQDLEEGVTFEGRIRVGQGREGEPSTIRFRQESDAILLPHLKGTDENIEQLRATQFPVAIVLGDDMDTVFDPKSNRPIRIHDRNGRIVQEIPVGTPDPVTGEPMRDTRQIVIRLMQGFRFTSAT